MKHVKRAFKYISLTLLSSVLVLGALYLLFPNWVKNTAVDLLYPTVTIEEKYIGHFSIEVPQVYELMYIACSLTETFQNDRNLIGYRAPDYREEVTTHFGPYQNHPLVLTLQDRLKGNAYSQLQPAMRLFSLNYALNEANGLEKQEIFHVNPILLRLFRSMIFDFDEHQTLIEDFAAKTNFYQFHQKHQHYYDKLKANYARLCDLDRMWKWMESRSQAQYDSYRIIYSPLTGGFHNTIPGLKDSESGLKQTWMFIAPPPRIGLDTLALKEFKILSSKLEREVFTEISHNYVNPISDQYINEIEQAMPDYTQWNKQKSGYSNNVSTYNEYMTWAVFSLYAMDTYAQEDLEEIISIQEDFMVDRRKFVLYKEFNQYLMQLYQDQKQDAASIDIEALYPATLAWMSERSSQAE